MSVIARLSRSRNSGLISALKLGGGACISSVLPMPVLRCQPRREPGPFSVRTTTITIMTRIIKCTAAMRTRRSALLGGWDAHRATGGRCLFPPECPTRPVGRGRRP